MSKEKEETVRIPIEATYQLYNGKLTLVDAKYADVSADAIARLLLGHFNIPIELNPPNIPQK